MIRLLSSACLMLTLVACSVTKYVPEGRFLLDDVKVYTADEEAKVGDLTSYLRQRPNAKWFSLFKVPLYVYGWSGRDTTKWLNRMWRRVGDAPVIYDGEGNPWRILIQGTRGEEELSLELWPGREPLIDLLYADTGVETVDGVEVKTYSLYYDKDGTITSIELYYD